jgi:HEAT repeat protein
LAALDRPAALDGIKALMADGNETTRGQVVWAIARSGSVKPKEFASQLHLDQQPAYRNMLAELLLDPGDPRGASVLRDMINGDDETGRLIAAQRLLTSQFPDRSRKVVVQALASASEQVRELAIRIAPGQTTLRPPQGTAVQIDTECRSSAASNCPEMAALA